MIIILSLIQIILIIGLMILGIHTNMQLKECRWKLFLANLDNKRIRKHNLELAAKITEQKVTIQELRNRHAMLR